MAAKKAKAEKDDDTAEIEQPTDFHAELEQAFDEGPKMMGTAVGAAPGGLLRAVFQGLAGEGVRVSSLGQWIAIVSLILEIYEQAKPSLEELIRQIRERLSI